MAKYLASLIIIFLTIYINTRYQPFFYTLILRSNPLQASIIYIIHIPIASFIQLLHLQNTHQISLSLSSNQCVFHTYIYTHIHIFNLSPFLSFQIITEKKKNQMGLRDIGASLPPGFRFYPSDEELVCHYLYKKITNEEVLKGTLIEIDLHICEPWQLPGIYTYLSGLISLSFLFLLIISAKSFLFVTA